MFTPWLLSELARAFMAGDSKPDAVVERCTALLGKPWRWLRPIAVRYHETVSPASRPNPPLREVLRFLQSDEGFRSASQRHREALELLEPIPDPPAMRPVAEGKNWPLPAITTAPELAQWLDLSIGELEWFADLAALGYKNKNPRLRHYRYRVLQKDAMHLRLIEAPKERLKKIQQKILREIFDQVPLHHSVHGFRKGRSIQTFCQPHAHQLVVVKMDLRDFFPSISRARIQALFHTLGYPKTVADLLGGLCTNATPLDIWRNIAWETQLLYRRPHLPQGAPSSPALANLCAYRLDCRLSAFAERCSASYTRYADDLAFSGSEAFAKCSERFSIQVAAIAAEEGFAVHHRKTRLMRRSVRQHVAGLVINELPNIRRSDFDELKAILTNCARSGAETQNRDAHRDFRMHLQGRVAFVKLINTSKGAKLEKIFERISWEPTV